MPASSILKRTAAWAPLVIRVAVGIIFMAHGAQKLFGVLGGGFAGVYTLGMFTRRANWQGVSIGVALSISLTVLAWSVNLVHPYFYLAISQTNDARGAFSVEGPTASGW